MLTFAALNRHWPYAAHSLVEGIAASAPAVFAKYGLDTATAQADFLAQVSEETGAGTEVEENLNYTAERLVQVWPSRFPALAAAAPYAHNPRLLADTVYGGRMGNVAGSDDGWRYRGRGLIQETGHDNYAAEAQQTGLDCVANPDMLIDPTHCLEFACSFWLRAGLTPVANAGNFKLETLRLNGGYTNWSTREQWRAVWREELGA